MSLLRYSFRKQAGAALPIALVMLLISTMVGLAAIRSATNQEKMSANMYDRSIAYQAAEEALRAAEEKILNTSMDKLLENDLEKKITANCLADPCTAIPESTFTGSDDGTKWVSIKSSLQKNTSRLAEKVDPQYYIERIGQVGGTDELGVGNSANCANYGGCDETPPSAMLFRVTARSGDPTAENNENRAIVALQTTVKQNM